MDASGGWAPPGHRPRRKDAEAKWSDGRGKADYAARMVRSCGHPPVPTPPRPPLRAAAGGQARAPAAASVPGSRRLPGLLALLLLLLAGCAEHEPRFNVIPRPLGTSLMEQVRREAAWPQPELLSALDAAITSYQEQYLGIVTTEALPLCRDVAEDRRGEWRSNAEQMERWGSRHAAIIARLAALDEGFLSTCAELGLAPEWISRLRLARSIERSRAILEAGTAPILDLREVAARTWMTDESRAALQPVLDEYASRLGPLVEAQAALERSRMARTRRILDQLTRDAAAAPPGPKRGNRRERDLERQAQQEAAVPLRKGWGRIIDLACSTVEGARGRVDEEDLEHLRRAVQRSIAFATGGGGAPEFLADVAMRSDEVPEPVRHAIAEDLERYHARRRALEAKALAIMRDGEPLGSDPQLQKDRAALENDFLGRLLGRLPDPVKTALAELRGKPRAVVEETVQRLAPGSAASLLRRMPAAFAEEEPEEDLPEQPKSSIPAMLAGGSIDRGWLDRAAHLAGVPEAQMEVLHQLRDDQEAELVRLREPLERSVEVAEQEMGRSVRTGEDASRAISAYLAAIDSLAQTLAASDEVILQSLASLAGNDEGAVIECILLQRRMARDAIEWNRFPFGEALGFSPDVAIPLTTALDRVEMTDAERMVASAAMREPLQALAEESALFRHDGLRAIHDAVVEFARLRAAKAPLENDLPRVVRRVGASFRASVERHRAAEALVVDALAEVLPQRAVEIRRARREAAFPELFLGDERVRALLASAASRSSGATSAAILARTERWRRELDELDPRLVSVRLETRPDTTPGRVGELRSLELGDPRLVVVRAMRREIHARALRDAMLLAADPDFSDLARAWLAGPVPQTVRIYE